MPEAVAIVLLRPVTLSVPLPAAKPSPDVVSMFMLAIPMIGLYFAAWGIAHLHDRRVAKRMEREFGTPV